MGHAEMKDNWKVFVPVDKRPTKTKQNKFNIDNIFAVTLRDSGEVALIDGDSKEIVAILKTGYAVHISRSSHPGATSVHHRPRRQGRHDRPVAEPAQVVADHQDRPGGARWKPRWGYEDKIAIAGAYWPPVRADGRRHPGAIKIESTPRHDRGYPGIPPGAACGSHRGLHEHPEFIVNVKGNRQDPAGGLQQPGCLTVTSLDAARFLHDGGWDAAIATS